MYYDWRVDKLVLNKHELFIIRLLKQKWFVLAEEEGELLIEWEMCLDNGMLKAAERLHELISAKRSEKSEVVNAALFSSGGLHDTLFGGEEDILVVDEDEGVSDE